MHLLFLFDAPLINAPLSIFEVYESSKLFNM